MGWAGRLAYLSAKEEQKRVELYEADLLWLMVSRYYEDLPRPSTVYHKNVKVDKRTAKQIQNDILKKLGVKKDGSILTGGKTDT